MIYMINIIKDCIENDLIVTTNDVLNSSIGSIKPSKLIYIFNFMTLNICLDLKSMTINAFPSLSTYHSNFFKKKEDSNSKESF